MCEAALWPAMTRPSHCGSSRSPTPNALQQRVATLAVRRTLAGADEPC